MSCRTRKQPTTITLTTLRSPATDPRVDIAKRAAFTRMLDEIESGERQRLSYVQTRMVDAEAKRLELDAVAETEAPARFDFGPLVKSPPGRRATWVPRNLEA